VGPLVRKMDEAASIDRDVLRAMHESGYMGIEIPAKYGGSEMSFLASCLAVEEFAKVRLPRRVARQTGQAA
jgi:alkylation response protein AidB-like acyl-CoA dehydrogenase